MSGTTDNPATSVPTFDPLASAMDRMGLSGDTPTAQAGPVYKAVGDSKIPVSPRRGKLWKARRDAGIRAQESIRESWQENLSYYNQDQSQHREGSDGNRAGNRYTSRRINSALSVTENIVYANIRALVPELYAKNPVLDATAEPDRTEGQPNGEPDDDANTRRARAVGKLVTLLFRMKAKPGVNLKPLFKKGITLALLTNVAWIQTGFVQKEQSSEGAYKDLTDLSEKLKNAKTTQEITDIEGRLIALEEKIDFLSPGGPWARLHMPDKVIVDPSSQDPWLSDANWVMIEDMLPTSYIKAVYAQEPQPGQSDEEMRMLYEPTHILTGKTNEDDESFSIFDKGDEGAKFGYKDPDTFNDAKRTKVWYVWDKVTRRLELYHDKNWKWPIWVWDDPLQLDTFFPLTPIIFHESPNNRYSKAPVSYYLDQQDMINEINDEKRRALQWAKGNIFFNKKYIDRKDVSKIIKGESDGIIGIDLPDDKKITDVIFSVIPPSMAHQQLMDVGPLYAAIDRIDASNEAMRGGQFKTNTTNQAIDYYSTMGNMRLDERLDTIEEAIGDVGWKIGQLCLRFMSAETVAKYIRMDVADIWKPIDPAVDFDAASITCVGGSTQKLTSKQRKKEAIDVGQILSQFSKAAPGQVLKATLSLFSKAFDDVVFTKEDWDAINAELSAMAPGGGMVKPAGAEDAPNAGGPEQALVMVAQILQQLPPDLLKGLGMALAQGVPPMEILAKVMERSGAAPPTAEPAQQPAGA